MYKLKFYSKSILEHFFVPDVYYRKRLSTIFSQADEQRMKRALKRVNYYFTRKDFFNVDRENSNTLESLSCFNKSSYYYDIRAVLRYFPKKLKFNCKLGDVISVPEEPSLLKSRPIKKSHENSIIFKLNQVRHFREIKDPYTYEGKLDKLVWRGASYNITRDKFVTKFFNNPYFDVGITKGKSRLLGSEFQKPFLPISQQLRYKFISSIEGNDVATNLKWIAQSNSLCFMLKPRNETWFMENLLIPDYHYVEIPDDLNDLPMKIKYFIENPEEAKVIVKNFQLHYSQFLDTRNELLVALLVAVKYFFLSRQLSLKSLGLEYLEDSFLG